MFCFTEFGYFAMKGRKVAAVVDGDFMVKLHLFDFWKESIFGPSKPRNDDQRGVAGFGGHQFQAPGESVSEPEYFFFKCFF